MRKILATVLSLVLAVQIFFIEPTPVHAAGPTDYVSCFNMDETSGSRIDSNTTNSNDLTDVNTVLSTTGIISNAADFEDATSEYLNITDANQVGLDFTGDRTFSFWVKPETTPTAGAGMAMIYKWSASQQQYGLIYVDVAGTKKIRFIGYNTCGGSNINHDWTTGALSTSVYTHVLVTYTQSNSDAELWINGVSQGIVDAGFTGGANCTGAFSISSLGAGIQWYWDGAIDIAEMYSRVLTSTEIGNLYNSGSALACTARSDAPATPAPSSIIFFD